MAYSYLIRKDYYRSIQETELSQISSKDASLINLVENGVKDQIAGYLIQKYDLSLEFAELTPWAFGVIYFAEQRVYLDAAAYNTAATSYAAKSLVLYQGAVYYNPNALTGSPIGNFNPSNWTLLGNQYDIFFGTNPKPKFNQKEAVRKGTERYWNNKVYTAQQDLALQSHDSMLEIIDVQSRYDVIPTPGAQYSNKAWGSGIAYSIAADTLPTDATKWTKGDNRAQNLINIFVDMVIYNLSARIAPNNVPQHRSNKMDAAILTLEAYAKGDQTASIPRLQTDPSSGNAIRWGGVAPNQNYW